jgi:hypothetical protein
MDTMIQAQNARAIAHRNAVIAEQEAHARLRGEEAAKVPEQVRKPSEYGQMIPPPIAQEYAQAERTIRGLAMLALGYSPRAFFTLQTQLDNADRLHMVMEQSKREAQMRKAREDMAPRDVEAFAKQLDATPINDAPETDRHRALVHVRDARNDLIALACERSDEFAPNISREQAKQFAERQMWNRNHNPLRPMPLRDPQVRDRAIFDVDPIAFFAWCRRQGIDTAPVLRENDLISMQR